jgi:hypothetical protein
MGRWRIAPPFHGLNSVIRLSVDLKRPPRKDKHIFSGDLREAIMYGYLQDSIASMAGLTEALLVVASDDIVDLSAGSP